MSIIATAGEERMLVDDGDGLSERGDEEKTGQKQRAQRCAGTHDKLTILEERRRQLVLVHCVTGSPQTSTEYGLAQACRSRASKINGCTTYDARLAKPIPKRGLYALQDAVSGPAAESIVWRPF
jgi:hypothetical protein